MTARHLLAAALLVACPLTASAADRTETVTFKPGTFNALRKAAIKGRSGVNYLVSARAGQVMQVLFSPSNRSCYMNVLPPGGGDFLFNGSITGNEFTSNLTASGTYTVQVYLMRNAARRNETCTYTVSFEITG